MTRHFHAARQRSKPARVRRRCAGMGTRATAPPAPAAGPAPCIMSLSPFQPPDPGPPQAGVLANSGASLAQALPLARQRPKLARIRRRCADRGRRVTAPSPPAAVPVPPIMCPSPSLPPPPPPGPRRGEHMQMDVPRWHKHLPSWLVSPWIPLSE